MSQNHPAGLAHAKKLIKENLETKDTFLDLGNCGLRDLSELPELWECQHLEGLNMGYCKVRKSLLLTIKANNFKPNKIGDDGAILISNEIKNITHLNLENNDINLIGIKSIASNLPELRELNLNYNILSSESLSTIADNFPKIQSLHLKQIIDIEIVKNKEDINIFDELISNILLKHSSLIVLDISYNNINKLNYHDFDNFDNLKIIDLSNNPNISNSIVGFLNKCKDIERLSLWNCNVSDNEINEITNRYLKIINISDNLVTNKGISYIVSKFENLESLDFSGNFVEDISAIIPYLKAPHSINFNYSNNPILVPPIEIVIQGRKAILRYYENLEKAKKVSLSPIINKEVKLIIAGNSNAGKSTLVKYLTEGVIDKNLPSTHWMEIKNWINPFPNKPHIENIRILDFGGQEYYHDTHYLFFTQNTAYILLWDEKGNVLKNMQISQKSAVDGQKKDVNLQCFPLEYWLDAISHYASTNFMEDTDPSYFINEIDISKEINVDILNDLKNAVPGKSLTDAAMPPVLIVQNKLDNNAPSKLPLNIYQDKYYDILIYDGIAISLFEERFLDNLRYYIASMLEDMNIVGKQFPGIYGIIKERIISPNIEMSLTIDQFMVKSNEWILEEGKKSGKDFASLTMDHENTKDCAQVFSWLGYIMYFPDSANIGNKVFLNQSFVMDSIYKILFNAESTFGEIDKKSGKERTELVEENITDILALMQEFKIIFKHPDPHKLDTYIAPLYLPNHPTKGISFFLSSLQKPSYRIQYDGFIHKSIILEFFQEYGQHVLKESNVSHEDVFYYWRKGIVIKKAVVNESEGLVLVQFFDGEDTQDKDGKTVRLPAHIDIFSLKDGSENLIKEIKDKLAEINTGWKVTEMVTADGTNFVPLVEIHKSEASNQYIFQYAGQQFQLIHFKQYLKNSCPMKKVFISYSKSDEHYRNELEKHLSVLKRNGHIATWHDRKLLPGEKWDGKIKQELKEADIIIFLVSADFLATDYIWDVELGTALERDNDPNDKVSVVPIILKKCDWMDSPLGKFNSPVKGKDISTAPDKDEAIYEIVKELKELIISKQ